MTRNASRNEILAALRIRSAVGIGAVLGNRLIQAFGSAADALAARPADWAGVEGIGPQIASNLKNIGSDDASEALLRSCESRGVRVLLPESDGYPPQLMSLSDRPLVLFARGACRWPERCIALVGTRLPSPSGLKMARELAAHFASRGIGVVSGLARGIDTAAHEGALDAGGETLAVIGSGVDSVYPVENRGLAERIESSGTVLSEYPPDTEAEAFHFPVRNRIISGLAQGVVVVEAPRRSGALGTADWALDQGREVMAVPAGPYVRSAQGSVDLIKKGAACVTSAEDVLQALRWEADAVPQTRLRLSEPALGMDFGDLLNLFQAGEPLSTDQLVGRIQWETPRLLRALAELELRGVIASLPGQRWCLR